MLANAQFSPTPAFESDETMAAGLRSFTEEIAKRSATAQGDRLFKVLTRVQEENPLLIELKELLRHLEYTIECDWTRAGEDSTRASYHLRFDKNGFSVAFYFNDRIDGDVSFERADLDHWKKPPTAEEVLNTIRTQAQLTLVRVNGESEEVQGLERELANRLDKILQKPEDGSW